MCNKILLVLNGESFRSGNTHSRVRGDDKNCNKQQIEAAYSHVRLIKYIEKKFNKKCEIYINSYTSGQEHNLIKIYKDYLISYNFNECSFNSEFEFINNTIDNLVTNIDIKTYEYIFFIRVDYYLKKYFFDTIRFENKALYAFVDSNPITPDDKTFEYFNCVCFALTLIPNKFYKLLKDRKAWYQHHSASLLSKELQATLDEPSTDIDLFVPTLHWSNSSIEWNPLFVQCGRVNTFIYNEASELQQAVHVDSWVVASNGLFYNKNTGKKNLSTNYNTYKQLRDTQEVENININLFY